MTPQVAKVVTASQLVTLTSSTPEGIYRVSSFRVMLSTHLLWSASTTAKLLINSKTITLLMKVWPVAKLGLNLSAWVGELVRFQSTYFFTKTLMVILNLFWKHWKSGGSSLMFKAGWSMTCSVFGRQYSRKFEMSRHLYERHGLANPSSFSSQLWLDLRLKHTLNHQLCLVVPVHSKLHLR